MTINTSSLAALVAKMKAAQVAAQKPPSTASELVQKINADFVANGGLDHLVPKPVEELTQEELDGPETVHTINIPIPDFTKVTDKYGNEIKYNERQSEFIQLAASGKSAILIGAAGTGKTTCQKGVCSSLIQSGVAGILDAADHKHLSSGTPGIVICAYTRRAVANIKRNMPADLQANCITIHKLLEYQPEYYDVIDPVTGQSRSTMKFEPNRNSENPLPSTIHTIIFEESSMIGTDLYEEVKNAMAHEYQEIFLGDIQQLPPVFGPAILGFKLLELATVELTEVYRQALESPIIRLAHRVLSGNKLAAKEFPEWKVPGQLTIHPWKKKISPENACMLTGTFFIEAEKAGQYLPEEDMILIPFNKAFGTDELNKIIANHLARKNNSYVYQVIAGFNRLYFRIGEKILVDKEDATIVDIYPNPAYTGADPSPHSTTLDYWGFDSSQVEHHETEKSDEQVDFILAQVASTDSGDRVKQASHTIVVRMLDSDVDIRLTKASELNSILLGYALTVHKAQGSEWRKVYFVTHQSHSTMLQRELIYTAITRAREELYIICEPDMLEKGIESQRIKGNTLAEKAEYFKGKVKEIA